MPSENGWLLTVRSIGSHSRGNDGTTPILSKGNSTMWCYPIAERLVGSTTGFPFYGKADENHADIDVRFWNGSSSG